MFNTKTIVSSPYQALAIVLATALILWSAGAYATKAQAANLVELSNTLTDSAPEAQSGHQFRFIVPAGSDIDGDIEIEFPSEFGDVNTVVIGDVTVEINGSPVTPSSVTSDSTTVTIVGVTASAGDVVTIDIDEEVVTNPTISDPSESFEFQVTTVTSDGTDIGYTRVVIIDTVLVTASVDTVFTFTISGTGTTPVNINGTDTTGTTSATEVPFGTLTPGDLHLLAQQLNVTTNAGNGFVVTVESDSNGDLVSATGADINQFVDASGTLTPTPWVAPTNDVTNSDTWGHWGLTSVDGTLDQDGVSTLYDTDEYTAVTGSPQPIFFHDGPSDGTTPDIGETLVGYRVEITPLQEAAQDYQTTLTYIATPTF